MSRIENRNRDGTLSRRRYVGAGAESALCGPSCRRPLNDIYFPIITQRRRNRRGAILLVVAVCLMVAAMVSVGVARQAGTSHRAVRTAHWTVQARWLAEAGVERAFARLAIEPSYAGEKWRIAAKELDGPDDAEVRIKIDEMADQPGRRTIRAEADYPQNADLRCRSMKQIEIDL